MRDFRKLRFNNIFLQLQVTVGHKAPIDNRYTFKYSEGITLGLLLLLMLTKMYSTLMSML